MQLGHLTDHIEAMCSDYTSAEFGSCLIDCPLAVMDESGSAKCSVDIDHVYDAINGAEW